MLRMTINRIDGEDSIFTDIGVTMFLDISETGVEWYETRPTRWQQRFEEFRFVEFAEEPQCHATHILVRMLQVISDGIARRSIPDHSRGNIPYKNHLLL
jgi:hypothetical protein